MKRTLSRHGHLSVMGLALTLLIQLSFIAPSYGLAPLGAPRAQSGDQRWTTGFSLGHQSTDMSLSGVYSEVVGANNNPVQGDFDLNRFRSTMLFGQLDYGIHEHCDLFLVLGASNAQGDAKLASAGSSVYIGSGEQFKYDSSMNFAWGLGTRVTFHESADLSWGALGQITWYNPSSSRSSWTNPNASDESLNAELDLKFYEVQLAAGPTLNLGPVWVYGGPFLHFVDGNMSLSGTYTDSSPGYTSGPISGKFDVEQKSEIGLYLGGQWLMADNVNWYADAQFTGNAWGIGLGGLWRVE